MHQYNFPKDIQKFLDDYGLGTQHRLGSEILGGVTESTIKRWIRSNKIPDAMRGYLSSLSFLAERNLLDDLFAYRNRQLELIEQEETPPVQRDLVDEIPDTLAALLR